MEDTFSVASSLPGSPESEDLPLTVSPSATSLEPSEEKPDSESKSDEKKPTKKRKSWGQELPTPKTNLPPRKRAKTDDEKEQRRIERVLRNRAAAQTSRERKRLEMEKLEGEKVVIEQQNQSLLEQLTRMETENNRLNKQVAQLSAEIRVSRGNTPTRGSSSPISDSPTLTATLFKQEGDEPSLERIPFPTPSLRDNSPTLEPSSLAESSDMAQHPAAVLCGLQCQSMDSKEKEAAPFQPSISDQARLSLALLVALRLLFQMMTFSAYSTVVHPLSQILHSLKTGSSLTFLTEEIYQHFPLILWLISTPSLSNPKVSSRPTVFRMRLLTRLLACSPALARPLRDATGKALQLAVSEHVSQRAWSIADDPESRRKNWESLLTLAWAIDCLERSRNCRRLSNDMKPTHGRRQNGRGRFNGSARSTRSSGNSETLTSLLMGKH